MSARNPLLAAPPHAVELALKRLGANLHTARMRRNLESTKGLIFSGQLLLDLAAAGMLREQAYKVVQRHAMQAWENEGDFRAAVENDPEVLSYLSAEKIAQAFSLDRYLTHVDRIFERVFQSETA